MNDPLVIAKMWYQLLVEDELFNQKFENIVFAVLDRNDRGTFAAFDTIFAPKIYEW